MSQQSVRENLSDGEASHYQILARMENIVRAVAFLFEDVLCDVSLAATPRAAYGFAIDGDRAYPFRLRFHTVQRR